MLIVSAWYCMLKVKLKKQKGYFILAIVHILSIQIKILHFGEVNKIISLVCNIQKVITNFGLARANE